MGKRIFVGNLPYSATESDLRALFSEIGNCDSASIVEDRDSGRSRGFGFVEMGSDEEASRAIAELDGREMQGRKINVSEAHERPQRRPRRF